MRDWTTNLSPSQQPPSSPAAPCLSPPQCPRRRTSSASSARAQGPGRTPEAAALKDAGRAAAAPGPSRCRVRRTVRGATGAACHGGGGATESIARGPRRVELSPAAHRSPSAHSSAASWMAGRSATSAGGGMDRGVSSASGPAKQGRRSSARTSQRAPSSLDACATSTTSPASETDRGCGGNDTIRTRENGATGETRRKRANTADVDIASTGLPAEG